jgi:D-alanyl-D-alanine carboxypeptidase
VLAERIAGSETQFAIKMTSVAHGLGMYGSHFMNATGLPHDWQTTTAHDMAVLALRIIRDFPQYYPYFGVDSLYYNGRYLRSSNKFVAHYPGAEGMKTGYTCGAGYNLVATASQYGKRLIGVVLGGHSSHERYQQMFTMMDIGFGDEYGTYRSKNINTMSKSAVGTPPYQLGCGHRPSSHYAARHVEEVEDDDHHVRYVRKVSHSSRRHVEKSRPAPVIPREITKVRIAGKTKTIVKQVSEPHYVAKASKNSRKESKVSKKTTKVAKATVTTTSKKTSKKTIAPVAKNKSSKKSEKAIQVAKVTTRGKGYYVPGSNEKKNGASTTKSKSTKSPASKGKGYYKPESSSKTVVKTTSKTKKTSKKKS